MTQLERDLNSDFIRSLPDGKPVVAINFMRLRDGVGMDAYRLYMKDIARVVKANGGEVLWTGSVEGAALGQMPGGRWDFSALVRYPSRAAFLRMMESDEFARLNPERERCLEDQVILFAAQNFPNIGAGA